MLQSQKVNWTTQRKVIYELVCSSEDHPTANDIMEWLREAGHHFAYGTVYNSLRYLTDSGLIAELKLGDSASRYDGRTEDHVHLICDRCGRIREAPMDVPSTWTKALCENTGYQIDGIQMVIHGVCSDCQREAAK